MSWDLFAVVELGTMRVMSRHPNIKEAAHVAHRTYRHCPCDIMALVLDDAERPIGVQQLSRRELRGIIGWRPEFRMRLEDVVNSRHKYDPPENDRRLQTHPERNAAPAPAQRHPDVL